VNGTNSTSTITTTNARSGQRAARRGYALAMATVLLLVASVLIIVILDRQSAHRLMVRRQLQQYVEEQSGRGMREAIEAWLAFQRSEDLREALDQDGLGFTVRMDQQGLAQGQQVRVFFGDGQGTMLRELAGLDGESFKLARDALVALRREAGAGWARQTRPEGPVAISVSSASRETLLAMVRACLDDGLGAPGFVDELLSVRSGGPMTLEDLGRLISQSGLPAEGQAKLQQALTATPSLWWIEARTETADPNRPPLRYGGYAIINRPGSVRASNIVRRASMILTWERLPDE
jgi:hypothetical protein